tara:strand:+ start:147 stop:1010 length:864 start_codon:yes stop_codon:yes gene_type:complete
MGMRTTLDLKSFSSVAWGAKPEVKIPGGPDYHEIYLETTLLPEHFRVEIIVNGDTRIALTGEQLVMLQDFQKIWTEAGRYVIPFGNIAARSIEGQMIGGMETLPSDNIIMRVHIVADPGGQPALSLKANAMTSPHLRGELGRALAVYWPRITEVTFDAGNSGKNVNDTIPQGKGMKLLTAHIKGSVDKVEVKKGANAVNGTVVWQRESGLNEFLLKRWERAPQSGYYHVDFVESGFLLAEMLPMDDVPSTVFDIYANAPGNLPILLQYLEEAPDMEKRLPQRDKTAA